MVFNSDLTAPEITYLRNRCTDLDECICIMTGRHRAIRLHRKFQTQKLTPSPEMQQGQVHMRQDRIGELLCDKIISNSAKHHSHKNANNVCIYIGFVTTCTSYKNRNWDMVTSTARSARYAHRGPRRRYSTTATVFDPNAAQLQLPYARFADRGGAPPRHPRRHSCQDTSQTPRYALSRGKEMRGDEIGSRCNTSRKARTQACVRRLNRI